MQGDILEADAEALVNTVNCVGVMGRGVALRFKNAFPANFKAYAAACKREEVQPGHMFVFDTGQLSPRWIVNFPTKKHWRGKSRMEFIETGMEALVDEIGKRHMRSIAIPPLGSGLGGLSWATVRPVIEAGLAELPGLDVTIYEPGGGSGEPKASERPEMTPGRAALIGLIKRYLAAMMDTSITLLEIHKLMYFLEASGEPLRLRYVKGPYGPYADNLRHVLRDVNGHLTEGYTAEGDAPTEQVRLLPGAVESSDAFLAAHPGTQKRLSRVGELVEGFETPFGLELLATIHWIMHHEQPDDERQIEEAFYAWGPGKKRFTPAQIAIAVAQLRVAGFASASGRLSTVGSSLEAGAQQGHVGPAAGGGGTR